jgi:hypothetical protein
MICRDAAMTNISRRRSRRSDQYPLASIAPYGPDDTFATKLVVSVLERPGQRKPAAMRTWTTHAVDVRHDPTLAASVADFLREYGVRHTVTSDRIMGCPHQEGIDYPMGRNCPRCPFWAGINRFTHEPRRVPTPTLSPSEILTTLSRDASTQPAEALASAESHREALIEPLLSALDRGVANPASASIREANLFSYALYLSSSIFCGSPKRGSNGSRITCGIALLPSPPTSKRRLCSLRCVEPIARDSPIRNPCRLRS